MMEFFTNNKNSANLVPINVHVENKYIHQVEFTICTKAVYGQIYMETTV